MCDDEVAKNKKIKMRKIAPLEMETIFFFVFFDISLSPWVDRRHAQNAPAQTENVSNDVPKCCWFRGSQMNFFLFFFYFILFVCFVCLFSVRFFSSWSRERSTLYIFGMISSLCCHRSWSRRDRRLSLSLKQQFLFFCYLILNWFFSLLFPLFKLNTLARR